MKKSELRTMIKEVYKNILNEDKFLKSNLIEKGNLKLNVNIPLTLSFNLLEKDYESGNKTYSLDINYDNHGIEKQLDKILVNEFMNKIIKKHVNKYPELKNIFDNLGGHSMIGFLNTAQDKYNW